MTNLNQVKKTVMRLALFTLVLSVISCGPSQNRDNTGVYDQGNSDRVDNNRVGNTSSGMDNNRMDNNRLDNTGMDNTGNNTGIDSNTMNTGGADNNRLGNDRMNAQQHQEKDAKFLKSASESNLKQIQLAQLAQKNGRTSEVRELGKMMEEAHTKSQKDLKTLAGRKNITITSSLNEEMQEDYNDLLDESDDNFDKAYTDLMISAHEDSISEFEKASNDSSDTEIKTWATTSLTGLREHLDHTRKSQKKSNDMGYLEKNRQ